MRSDRRHRQRPDRRSAPRTALPDGRAQRLRSLAVALILAALIMVLNGCGGGGGSAASTGLQSPNNPQQTADLATAQKAYDGTPRTPAEFLDDPAPSGVTGIVATTHLKNSDLAGAAQGAPAFELCSDDMSQATAWSEGKSSFMGGYSDLVDVTGNARYWELTRVPRTDASARLRHRVFKCGYVNRAGFDPAQDNGAAGALNWRPLDAPALRDLSEYLWRFTVFNNADYVVLQSAPASAAAGLLAHDIEMAHLTRAPVAGDCDRIDILRWTHTVNLTDGSLLRALETRRSFRARRVNGAIELCAG